MCLTPDETCERNHCADIGAPGGQQANLGAGIEILSLDANGHR
jgi:hypothetical protein